MTHNHFSYKELLMFGWEKTKEHFLFLISLVIAAAVISFATANMVIVRDIMQGLISIAAIAVLLIVAKGHTPAYKDLLIPFKTYNVTLNYFISTILYALAVLGGLILLILPGMYLSIRLQFYAYLVVEHENMGPIEALKKSWAMTEGRFWNLFGFMIVFILINLAGLIAIGIGLLFTLPVTVIAYTELYRKLSSHEAHRHNDHHNHPHAHIASR